MANKLMKCRLSRYALYFFEDWVMKVGTIIVQLDSLLVKFIMWKFSNVFRCFPFCCTFIISIISLILPYACPVSRICCTYPDVFLLFRMSLTCSLNLVLNMRPVWPIYCQGQSTHFNL
jgi:hypothetical protein